MLNLQGAYRFDHSFRTLHRLLYEEVRPTPMRGAKLAHVTALKAELGLGDLTADEIMQWLNGEVSLPGDQRISTRYAGHQFGVWAGQLGDGRAISLGEILTPAGERWEIQTKGSGLTPFSRMGDGKAVIRSSVREYLCAEAMHGLGIPTTRSLALLTGSDQVQRETVERSAVVARVFPTNLRFGHFELCYHFNHRDALIELIEYTRKTFFQSSTVEEMLQQIVKRTAQLMAQWQSVGFCHGVMNTDNMSILGLTIDYGPFGFLEDTQHDYVCNHSDHRGRYAYNQQPSVGMWNLERLLVCFLDVVEKPTLEKILSTYPVHFAETYREAWRGKLGLHEVRENDDDLFTEILKSLSFLSIDYTFFFRTLSRYQRGDLSSLAPLWDVYGDRSEIKNWLERYDQRLELDHSDDLERSQRMLGRNPKYVLKNYIAQEVIDEVEAGRNEKLNLWLEVLARPFDEHPEVERYALPTPPEHKHLPVSCSS